MRRVWVQTEASLPTLSAYGVDAEVTGDPRFDRVLDAVGRRQPDQALQAWVNDRPCLVVGSAWPPEWDAVRAAWQEGQCAIVVPHEWTAEGIAAEASRWEAMGAHPVVWSAHRSKDARAALPEGDVLIVDAMGELLDAYALADVVVVGGGFGNGVHNTLEPAAHGKRILVGPEVGRFAEVATLEKIGALSVCNSPSALCEAIHSALGNVEGSRRKGAKAAEYAHQNAGAGMAIARGWSEAL
jgi:3-deoxy-D-manno-octulosonic-acid transferase